LITLLANQSLLVHNIRNKDEKKKLQTEEEVELLTSPYDLAEYKNAIMANMMKGTKRIGVADAYWLSNGPLGMS
jgi:hypothetical protein